MASPEISGEAIVKSTYYVYNEYHIVTVNDKEYRFPMSEKRKNYMFRLVCRCVILALCVVMAVVRPEAFQILEGMNFFASFSVLHLLWAVWVLDMILQIIPIQNKLALGSQKLWASHFRPIKDKINYESLRCYIISTTKAAYKIFVIWCCLIGALGILYVTDVIGKMGLFLITVFFYVCDLICVLIWCPFRLMLKNRCCTTCRIFNWDHIMMFSPLIFVGGFFSVSLVLLALTAWLIWELSVMMYPERFWMQSNTALRCSECTDKLCTQYCQKKRK